MTHMFIFRGETLTAGQSFPRPREGISCHFFSGMARTWKRKPGSRVYGAYTSETLKAALDDIKSGHMSLTKASVHHKISKGTLFNKMKQKHMYSVGRPLVFSSEEEEAMIEHMTTVAEWGFSFDSLDLRFLAKHLLDKQGRRVKQFGVDNMPSADWANNLA